MFFNLRPVANFGPVLPAVIKFYAVRLQWGVFIALMLFMLSKIPLIYARIRGGEYTRKEWSLYNKDVKNKGCKDVEEI